MKITEKSYINRFAILCHVITAVVLFAAYTVEFLTVRGHYRIMLFFRCMSCPCHSRSNYLQSEQGKWTCKAHNVNLLWRIICIRCPDFHKFNGIYIRFPYVHGNYPLYGYQMLCTCCHGRTCSQCHICCQVCYEYRLFGSRIAGYGDKNSSNGSYRCIYDSHMCCCT